jgi:hypothetical protein
MWRQSWAGGALKVLAPKDLTLSLSKGEVRVHSAHGSTGSP